jgi:hypothetical protein
LAACAGAIAVAANKQDAKIGTSDSLIIFFM